MTDYDRLARFYDLEHEDWQGDLALYAGFAAAVARGPRGRILELGCGTGRCLLPLAAAGHHVTGLDVSPAMLALAGAKAEAAGLGGNVRLVQGDMRAFALEGRYALIFVALNSLMHLESREAQRAALACAGRHLAADGRLVLDLFNPDAALPRPEQEGQLFLHCLKTLPGGGHRLHFQSPSVDRAAQVVSMANYYDEIDPTGAVKRYLAPFTLRYLSRGELELLIAAAGLELEAVYGGYDLEPFRADSEHLIAVARRPRRARRPRHPGQPRNPGAKRAVEISSHERDERNDDEAGGGGDDAHSSSRVAHHPSAAAAPPRAGTPSSRPAASPLSAK